MSAPAETPRESSLRSRVIWSYWVVILLLGLPTWWQTTSIYRASLPTDSMLHTDETPIYPVKICVTGSAGKDIDLSQVAHRTQELLSEKYTPITFVVQNGEHCTTSEDAALHLKLEPGPKDGVMSDSNTNTVRVRYQNPDTQQLSSNIAQMVTDMFANEQATVAYILATNGRGSDNLNQYIGSIPQEQIGLTEKASTRAFKPSPNYHLTFSLFSAGAAPSDWAVQAALSRHIYPLVHALSSAANFSIASQVQLYSAFSHTVQPQQASDGWFLRREDLTSFINTAEWPLSPSIGTGPTINFVLYVPQQKHMPLRIEGDQSNSWLIPQWGGITILNPPLMPRPESELGLEDLPVELDAATLAPVFETFQTQLLQLVGAPQSPQLPLAARLKAFQRITALSLYLRASSNLGSIARLAQSLSSIPIPKHVLHFVQHTLHRLDSIKTTLNGDGGSDKWRSTAASAQEAYSASEKAFFDKSMVGQVYFPDEHKVAVYLPLLGPIGVPLVIGLIREVKKFLARARS